MHTTNENKKNEPPKWLVSRNYIKQPPPLAAPG
jgi:hypothetical protein